MECSVVFPSQLRFHFIHKIGSWWGMILLWCQISQQFQTEMAFGSKLYVSKSPPLVMCLSFCSLMVIKPLKVERQKNWVSPQTLSVIHHVNISAACYPSLLKYLLGSICWAQFKICLVTSQFLAAAGLLEVYVQLFHLRPNLPPKHH